MNILPYSIKDFRIKNFQGIKDTSLSDLPATAKWIFITGKNGFGKTSLLRGITIGLYGKFDPKDKDRRLANDESEITLKINLRNNNKAGSRTRIMNKALYSDISLIAYGPVRIPSGRSQISSATSNVKSLFSTDGDILFNFEEELFDLYQEESNQALKQKDSINLDYNTARDLILELSPQFSNEFESSDFAATTDDPEGHIEKLITLSKKDHFVGDFLKKNKIIKGDKDLIKLWKDLKLEHDKWSSKDISTPVFDLVKKFLLELMDNISDIRVENQKLCFFEKEEKTIAKSINLLASGNRMLFTWVGDMLKRLDYKKHKATKELSGIVIIDEFDLHLHPVWQKKLPGILSSNLPNIQFIATTHSPIPLLGAPKDSVFLKVNRTEDEGITATRLDNKMYFDELLPNALLTSPVFEMEDIFSSEYKGDKAPRTEATYSELELNNFLDQQINDFLTDKKEKDLLNRINKKRKS